MIVHDPRRCNLHHYVLLREAAFFKSTEFFIDEFHALGHSGCSLNYNSSQFKSLIKDWSLAEQKNSPLSEMKNSFARMDQGSFLFWLRFKLACLNVYQFHHDSANSDVVFWKPPPRRVVLRGGDGDGYDEEDRDEAEEEEEEEDEDTARAREQIAMMLELAEGEEDEEEVEGE